MTEFQTAALAYVVVVAMFIGAAIYANKDKE
jgi:hypothetical protein